MGVEIKPEDLELCARCGRQGIVVSFWDEGSSKSRTKLVDIPFDYKFVQRNKKGELVVDDKDKVMAASHAWTCPAGPPSAPPEAPPADEETRPFERKRK